ncbi:MAG: hypothetical protein GY769_04360 [bacterium]|nr:hypothetical protein [bacterium]
MGQQAQAGCVNLVEPALIETPWETAFWQWGPSPHLTWRELNCNDGTPYPEEKRIERAYPLSVEFEFVRTTLGGYPIRVSSGYRTWAWNSKIGGARRSQHPEATAVDMEPPGHLGVPDLLEAVLLVAHRPGGRVRGIGVYRTFVHMDIRRSERVCRWKGSRVLPEVWKTLADA